MTPDIPLPDEDGAETEGDDKASHGKKLRNLLGEHFCLVRSTEGRMFGVPVSEPGKAVLHHPQSSPLIRAVCQACSAELRASDYFGRIGGEEFACVMPETDENEALACAERMRLAVAAIRIETPMGSVRCTISIGIAARAPEYADFTALLAAADAALYHAKSSGRDRVELAH